MAYEFADCRIDPRSRELFRHGRPVEVEPRTLDLLIYLIEHRDRAISKDELQNEVWGTIVTDAALARAVMKARKALGDSSQSPEIVKTVRGHGYRFVAHLETSAVPSDVDRPTTPDKRSIAVLPLANMSDDPANEFFSDGIAEEILNLLARLPDLRVASRTSSFSLRNTDLDIRAIADKLGVDYVLEGSVRRAGDRVRITAQLIDAAKDAHVLSEVYDRQLDDIFAVQAEIAAEVVGKLKIATAGDIRPYTATPNLEAYEFYLRGRHYFHQWDSGATDYSRQMFEKAIELDPGYAKAWAGLADALTMARMWKDDDASLLEKANQASLRAIELAPDLAESRVARGFVLSLMGRYDDAAREFEAAIDRNPMLFEAWYLFARSRFGEGKAAEAADLFRRAAALPSPKRDRANRYHASNSMGLRSIAASNSRAASS